MTAIRALHITAGNLYGGVETMLRGLAEQRAACPAIEPRFALCFEGRLADELRRAGVPVEILGPVRISRPWTVLSARGALRRLLARERPDVVIGHSPWSHAVFGPTARRAGLPLAFWRHEAGDQARFHDRHGARTPPDLVIANSRFTAATTGVRFPGVPVEVIYCPVPPPPAFAPGTREEVRRELGAGPEDVVLFQASRLDRLKGTHVLIEALGGLAGVSGWRFWLAAGVQRPPDRPYLDEMAARAEALGIADRVRFLGGRSDVPRLLAGADVYCQANVGPESFGISLVEALDAGLPVVTSRLGGAAEAVDETCGVLVPPGDVAALREALAGLIADPARRAALGAAGPPRARRMCDPAATLGRLAEALRRLVPFRVAASTR